MIDNRIFIPLIIALLILIGAFICSGGQPRPSLEQFPALPYAAPPTPQARAAQAAQAESNRLARAAHRAAVASLAALLGAPTGTTAEAVSARAARLADLATARDIRPPAGNKYIAKELAAFAAGVAATLAALGIKQTTNKGDK